MLKVVSTLPKCGGLRYSTKFAEKSARDDSYQVDNDVNGMTVISIKPAVAKTSKVAAVFHAGSRYENYESLGMNHLLRRSAGLSCGDITAVSVVRHTQQMGANLRCVGTRETLSYLMDFSFDLFPKISTLLSHIATRQHFYNWELNENTKILMKKDIELLNRRDFDTLCSELLHKAAFKNTLGNSLFVDEHRLGDWGIDRIEGFLDHRFIPGKSMLVGISVKHEDLVNLAAKFKIRPLKDIPPIETKFRGGEIRRDLPLEFAKVALAWEAPGFNNMTEALCTSVLAYAIDSGIDSRIKWNNGNLQLLRKLTKDSKVSDHCVANSLNISYSDKGLLGFNVTGTPEIMDAAISVLYKHFSSIGKSGVAKPEFDNAKSLLIHDLLIKSESDEGLMENVISQATSTNGILQIKELVAEVKKLSLDDVNKVAKSILGSGRVAMAAVGDLSSVPFVADLH